MGILGFLIFKLMGLMFLCEPLIWDPTFGGIPKSLPSPHIKGLVGRCAPRAIRVVGWAFFLGQPSDYIGQKRFAMT